MCFSAQANSARQVAQKAAPPVVTPPQAYTTYVSTSDGTPIADAMAPTAPAAQPTTTIKGVSTPARGMITRPDNNAAADRAARAARQSSMRVIS